MLHKAEEVGETEGDAYGEIPSAWRQAVGRRFCLVFRSAGIVLSLPCWLGKKDRMWLFLKLMGISEGGKCGLFIFYLSSASTGSGGSWLAGYLVH